MTLQATEEISTINPDDLEKLRSWIGRQDIVEETISPFPSAALAALLDRRQAPPRPGDAIPALAHWLHFLPVHAQSELAEDGHVRRGGFMPPVPLPRRMFGGGRVTVHKPLRIGERARRVGTVRDVTLKKGESGPLVLAAVRQEIYGADGLALSEDQDIIYRTPPVAGAAAPAPLVPPERTSWGERIVPDETMLFRYSALIFNAHRIHYDRPYAVGREGYPGLVVHGQLTATLLANLASRRSGAAISSFSFRARRALIAGDPFFIDGKMDGSTIRLWATDACGGLAMEARAELDKAGAHGS